VNEFDSPTNRLFGLFEGVVVDVADPEKLGRVTVRIPGLIEEQSAWAFPLALLGAGKAGGGSWAVPPVGAEVGVLFNQGNPEAPFYVAGHYGKPDGVSEVPSFAQDLADGDAPNVLGFELGGFVLVLDTRAGSPKAYLKDKTGGAELRIENGKATLLGKGDASVELVLETGKATLKAGQVVVDSADVRVAGDGTSPRATREGDAVQVTLTAANLAAFALANAGGAVVPGNPAAVVTLNGVVKPGGSSKVRIGG
jgi:hypothetical protein